MRISSSMSGADGAFSAALSQYNPARTGAVVDLLK